MGKQIKGVAADNERQKSPSLPSGCDAKGYHNHVFIISLVLAEFFPRLL
ncbi:hypothetical protein [Aeromonas cavernicola]|nr:hypothetical protein [Aeromonas cavernicola]